MASFHLFWMLPAFILLVGYPQWQLVSSTIPMQELQQMQELHQLKYSKEVELLEVASTDPNDVHFYLYSNAQSPTFNEELILNDARSVWNSNYDPSLPVIMLVHGFTQNFLADFPVLVKDAYLEANFASKANLICVDWGKLASPETTIPIPILGDVASLLSYKQACQNVPVVGKRMQEFLLFLLTRSFLPKGSRSVHLIGHSLGAHVVGFAGSLYQSATGFKIGRITGTDPAAPLFQGNPPTERLDSTDATLVDAIHTNQNELGYYGPLASVDFFVNGGGPTQPDCSAIDPSCSHNMAWRFYAESIETNAIVSCPCSVVVKNGTAIPIVKSCENDEQIIFGAFLHESSALSSGLYCLQMGL